MASQSVPQNENLSKLFKCGDYINSLLISDRYIARSDYSSMLSDYSENVESFKVLKESGMFEDFCKKYGVYPSRVENIIDNYKNIQELVEKHNTDFVEYSMVTEKKYLDNILEKVDPDIKLDDDQRRVILTDEDYCLVIAGAGAGKTTTVAAKVKYLVDKKGIDSSQILVVSFTNKAVNELKEKIQKGLGIDCPIAT